MFLDPDQFDGDVLRGDANDLPDFLIAHVFKPKQDDGPVHHAEFVDAAVELLDLSGVVVGVGEEVDVHRERHGLHAAFLLALGGEASVEADAPNPGLQVALPLKRVEASPQVDERLLEQVVGLVVVFREEIAHGVNRVFVCFHDGGKLNFFLLHCRNRLPIRRKTSEKTTKEEKFSRKCLQY